VEYPLLVLHMHSWVFTRPVEIQNVETFPVHLSKKGNYWQNGQLWNFNVVAKDYVNLCSVNQCQVKGTARWNRGGMWYQLIGFNIRIYRYSFFKNLMGLSPLNFEKIISWRVVKKLAFFKKHHGLVKAPSPYCAIQIFMFGG
jgi:hypothetical protein